MAQFSVKIMRPTGSVLGENQQPKMLGIRFDRHRQTRTDTPGASKRFVEQDRAPGPYLRKWAKWVGAGSGRRDRTWHQPSAGQRQVMRASHFRFGLGGLNLSGFSGGFTS